MQIQSVGSIPGIHTGPAEKKTGAASFGDILNEAINNAKETDAQDKEGTVALLSGQEENLHTTMIESQKAELALNLAIQIRNKVIDAYNEVMRMQL